MTQPNDGGPAFPTQDGPLSNGKPGMTLRDWFAGQVLQGLASDGDYFWSHSTNVVAGAYYEIADAMIRARSANA